jgi:hypothetical protein
MNSYKWITALAVLMLFAGLAGAQVAYSGAGTGPFACEVSVAAPPTLRAEGLTELVGDIVLTCSGGVALAPGSTIPTANITVSFGTTVTSRLLGYNTSANPLTAANTSEALLLIDEPGSGLTMGQYGVPSTQFGGNFGPNAPQTLCGAGGVPYSLVGAGAGGCVEYVQQLSNGDYVMSSSPSSAVAGANVFVGVVNENQVTFYGIPILPPATVGVARIFRMTNIRINANLLGLGAVSSLLSFNGVLLLISNSMPVAGFIQSGLTFQVRTPNDSAVLTAPSFSGCSTGAACPYGMLRFSENFGSAFRTRSAPTASTNGQAATPQNVPGTIYNFDSESGFTFPGITGTSGNAVAGLTDFGTRLKAEFSNVPAGVSIYVATTNIANLVSPPSGTSTTSFAQLVSGETAVDSNGSTPSVTPAGSIAWNGTPAAYSYAQLPVVNGSATAVWEVVNTNPAAIENFDFPVWIVYGSGVTPAALTIAGKVAPNQDSGAFSMPNGGEVQNATYPVPRFSSAPTAAAFLTYATSSTASGTYGVGASISIQVLFSSAVTVTGTPQLALNSGGIANYISGSGTSTLTFTYTVAAGQNTPLLDYASTSALTLNGGTIIDANSLPAVLTLPSPAAGGSLVATTLIVIDTTAPTVANVTSSTANGTYTTGQSISIQVLFSKTVNVTGTPELLLNSGGTASYSSGSGTSTLTFTYTVGAGDTGAHLDCASTGALTLNGGAIRDAALHNAVLTLASPGAAGSLGVNKSFVINSGASHPLFFTGEVFLGNGVYSLTFPGTGSLFGYYGYLGNGWIYHFDMGYDYVAPGNGPEVYLWDLASGDWWYTNASTFPFLYDFTLKVWLYYIPDTHNPGHYTTKPRYFVNMTTDNTFTM